LKNRRCDCPLDSRNTKVGFFGSPSASVVFVGESPGKTEELVGKPFVGVSGQLLRTSIHNAGISKEDICFANAARCLVDTAALTKAQVRDILSRCRRFICEFMSTLKPRLIVPVGDVALYQILRKNAIFKHRGRLYWSDEFDCWCFPILHPAGVLRDMSRKPILDSDLEVISRFIRSGFNPKVVTGTVNKEDPDRYVSELKREAKDGVIRVALDTETTGLDPYSSQIIGFSFSAHPGRGAFVWLSEPKQVTSNDNMFDLRWDYTTQRDTASGIKMLEWLLTNENVELIMQHGVFDLRHIAELFHRVGKSTRDIARNYRIELQVAAHLLDEETFTLASLDVLNDAFGTHASVWKDFDGQVFELAPDNLENYAVEDAVRTFDIGQNIMRILRRFPKIHYYFDNMAMPAVRDALFRLESNGILIDLDQLPEVRFSVANKLEAAEKTVISLLPKDLREKHKSDLSLTRKDIIRDYIYDYAGLKRNHTKKGKLSVTKQLLAGFLYKTSTSKKTKEFISRYLEWVEWSGISSRSLPQLESFIAGDGRVHSNYTICGAVTGRVASSKPNLMNIVARGEAAPLIKRLITAPQGYVLLEADFSQAELRWIAHLSCDKNMRNVYINREDIHVSTARALAPRYDSLSDTEKKAVRTKAKGANFGIVYGIGARGLKDLCLQSYGQDISLEEAKGIIRNWFLKYPGVLKWQEELSRIVLAQGYIDSPFGRRRLLRRINELSEEERARAVRQAINFPVQSASSDTALLALIEIVNDPDLESDICRPVLFVHDSMTFEIREDMLDTVAKRIRHHMVHPPLDRFGIEFSIPLDVDMAVGYNKQNMDGYYCE